MHTTLGQLQREAGGLSPGLLYLQPPTAQLAHGDGVHLALVAQAQGPGHGTRQI
ncbi:hypothetical protein D3C71_1820610 [compost metagenome]